MTRVSTAEMYDDKDVITQICRLKDGLNSALGGIIADIDIVNDELVIDWADGESIALPLPSPTGISSIAGSISGTNLTITIYMTDGSSHAFTCPLSGMASEAYVDMKDAQNVKLTGAQSVAGVKTFSDSPIVPTTPTSPTGAVNDVYVNDATEGVNNIVHKTGDESITGTKYLNGVSENKTLILKTTNKQITDQTNFVSNRITFVDNDNAEIGVIRIYYYADGHTSLQIRLMNSRNVSGYKWVTIAEGDY